MKKLHNFLYFISLKNVNFLFFLLLPVSFIIGSAVINILLFLISIVFIVSLYKEKKWNLFNNITFKLFVFFLIYASIVTTINSEGLLYSELIKIISYIKYILLFFFISYVYLNLEIEKKILFKNINYGIIIFFSVDLLFQYLTGSNILGYEPGMCFKGNNYFSLTNLRLEYTDGIFCQRLGGLFNQEFIAGTFLLFFGSIFIFLKFSKKKKFVLFCALNILIFLILITGDRTPLLMIVSSVFLFLLINKDFRKYLFIWISALTITFSILILISPQLYVRYQYVYNKIFGKNVIKNFDVIETKQEKNFKIDKESNISNIILNRFYNTPWGAHYFVSFQIIKDNPVFGQGLKTFKKKCTYYLKNTDLKNKSIACSNHPHNLFLEFLIDYGLFGLVLLIIIIYSIFYNKKIKQKIFYEPMLLYLICLLLMSLFPLKPSGSFFSTNSGTAFFYLLGWINLLLNKTEMKIK